MTLQPSSERNITLTFEVVKNIQMLEGMHQRVRGTSLIPPSHLATDLKLFRGLVQRHMEGDLRNSADEEKALQAVATWTLEMNWELRGQPKKKVQWVG